MTVQGELITTPIDMISVRADLRLAFRTEHAQTSFIGVLRQFAAKQRTCRKATH